MTGMSKVVMVSLTGTDTVVDGAAGAGVPVPAPFNGTDCVKFELAAALGRLLNGALSTKATEPVALPGTVSLTEKMQAPPGGRVVGREDAPFVQAVRDTAKGGADGVAERSMRFAWPRLETVSGRVPDWPPKPREAAEE